MKQLWKIVRIITQLKLIHRDLTHVLVTLLLTNILEDVHFDWDGLNVITLELLI